MVAGGGNAAWALSQKTPVHTAIKIRKATALILRQTCFNQPGTIADPDATPDVVADTKPGEL
jgi:hypothetical protein